MEYLRRQPMQSESTQETTAFTLRTIQEILADTGDEGLLIKKSAPPVNAPTPCGAAQPQLQSPPSAAQLAMVDATEQATRATQAAQAATAAAEHATRAAAATLARAEEQKLSRSLTSRIGARLFGRK